MRPVQIRRCIPSSLPSGRSSLSRRFISRDATNGSSPIAFAFDIDGVLIRGKQGLPAAKRALSMLDRANKLGLKIPYILLTNGGGVSEKAKAEDLTSIIGHEISPSRVILAHTVLKNAAAKYADQPVLVLGGKNDDVRKVAESYGFKHVYTSLDILAWNPATWPFYELNEKERQTAKIVDFSQIPLRAAFVFHDPRHWSLDIQILCDIILSGGIVGGPYTHTRGTNPIELVFCNPDLLWKSNFPQTRLGQGAFRDAFQAVFKSLTGTTYPYVQLGKPSTATYDYAKQVLLQQLQGKRADDPESTPVVYMVGDNPESDIAGANRAGWKSVLVRTGVYDPANGPPAHTPTREVEDVEDAVRWAIEDGLRL
ncbi:HAD-like domain-containing protein [Cristinia sonorae]|uniref:HAD-like domain-containing protein n=1 Tax=Cristinia sonorae TaxID=1940300 RepID=A0A8K0UE20_9AGAR|nr:HAD-like domain-containing protein [Cristinia sonorae]